MASGLLSKSSIESRRRMAEALLAEAGSGRPAYGGWGEGIARALTGVGAGLMMRNANNQDSENRSKIAQALQGGATPNELEAMALDSGYDELYDIAGSHRQQSNQDRAFDYQKGRDSVTDSQWGQEFGFKKNRAAVDDSHFDQQFGLEKEKWDFTKSQPFEVGGNLVDRETYKPLYESPQSPSTVINNSTGESNALNKKLDEAEAEEWSGYRKGAVSAGGIKQDMEVLDELGTMAPTGPVYGRLAENFRGFSSAGDAYLSVTKRLAPSLRTPGSGSQSDLEYDGFLQSIPRLSNQPGGNKIISETLKAKAQINIERGAIVDAYRMGKMDANTARAKLGELNQRSIMTPEMKAVIGQATGGSSDIDPLLDKYAPRQ